MIEEMFSKPIRVAAGIVFLVASAIVDIVGGYAYDYNITVSILAVIGVLSILGAIFSVKYIPYMVMNIAGYILGLLVISKKDSLGDVFVTLFLVIIFLAMWVVGMLVSKKETPVGKILGSLLVTIISIILILVVTFLVIFISLAMLW